MTWDKEVGSYSWIDNKEIVVDVLTKQGPRREDLDVIMIRSWFRNALDEKNCVKYKNGEKRVENLTMKSKEDTKEVG